MGVIVSPAVWAELMASGEPRPGVRELARTPSLLQKRLALSSLMQTLIAQLDSGEAEATALASELASPEPLLLEDSKGRRIALEQGLPAIDHAGVPIMAKDLGLPPRFVPWSTICERPVFISARTLWPKCCGAWARSRKALTAGRTGAPFGIRADSGP